MKKIQVPPTGWCGRFFDALFVSLMYLLSGTLSESPQKTHLWNNVKLKRGDIRHLSPYGVVIHGGIPRASARTFLGIPIFHIPILGGWREYLVLEPVTHRGEWSVGWITSDVVGVSRIKVKGRVRVLLHDHESKFFGVDGSGEQVKLTAVGRGRVGDGGPFAQIPLL